MGRSFANQAPNKESRPIHPTQELPGSALTVQLYLDGVMEIAWKADQAQQNATPETHKVQYSE
jgi:hypothetical protein